MAALRVLFIGLGPLGRMIASDFCARGLGELCGAVDIDPAIAGRRIGEVIGAPGPDLGEVCGTVEGALSAARPDCAVLATRSSLRACMPALRVLLGAGVSVVSTCEELIFPWHGRPEEAEELAQLCMRSGARCVGTGVNPGFLMDALPVFLTAVCRRVDRVRVERYQDASTRRVPFQKKIGAGLDEEAFVQRVRDGSLRHVGLGESMRFIDRALGMGVERWEESLEPVRAERAQQCVFGEIPAGGISGVRQVARGYRAGGEEAVTLDFRASIGEPHPRDKVTISGDPSFESTIPGAVHGDIATSSIVLNAIGPLLAAPPGLHTMATLPMIRLARGMA